MSDKKLPKIKHNHTLTDILKASIFSLVMMAPVTAIGVTCAYVVCNKNAYQSYYGETINEKEYLDVDNIELNKDYLFLSTNSENPNPLPNNTNIQITFDSLDILNSNPTFDNTTITRIQNANNGFLYFNSGTGTRTLALREDENTYVYLNLTNNVFELTFHNLLTTNNNVFKIYLKDIQYNKNSYLDNVFYYAVDTMQNNTLFSWTKTTAIYTPVSAMTTGMGINTPAIAVLLVYWLLCTAVYIIIDIVVKGFTWLTHLIGER